MKKLTLTVKVESPLHIGGETRRGTDAARPMLKDLNGLPYIPATSIKGRLRHAVEGLLRAELGEDAVCSAPTADHMCLADDVCPVCELFGSPWHEGALYFGDLKISAADREAFGLYDDPPPQTTSRAGIRINRRRRVVEEGFLFDTELFEPGVPWTFEGAVHCAVKDDELVPLYLAAKAVTMMGGGRTRGLGWCELTLTPEVADLSASWETWKEAHT